MTPFQRFTARGWWSTMSTQSRVRHDEVNSPASLTLRQVIHCSRMLLRRQSRLCKRFLVSGMICQKFRSLLPSRESTRRRFQAFRFNVFPLSPDNDGAAAPTRLGTALPPSVCAVCLFTLPPLFSPTLTSREGRHNKPRNTASSAFPSRPGRLARKADTCS